MSPTTGDSTVLSAGGELRSQMGLAVNWNGELLAGFHEHVILVDPVTGAQTRTYTPCCLEDFEGIASYQYLSIFHSQSASNALTLVWQGSAGTKLQRTPSITQPVWTDVQDSEGMSTLTITNLGFAEFFRINR